MSVVQCSPVGSFHVGLSLGSWGTYGVGIDTILGLELITEVSITLVHTLVPQHLDDGLRVQLGGGDGNGGQTGEDDLKKAPQEG